MSAPAVEGSSPGRLSTSVGQKRERKRELDRICQQRKRKRDRENVQKLEAKLQSLRQKADDKTVYEILMVREKDQARIARHKKRMHQIQDLLKADLVDLSDTGGAIILAHVRILLNACSETTTDWKTPKPSENDNENKLDTTPSASHGMSFDNNPSPAFNFVDHLTPLGYVDGSSAPMIPAPNHQTLDVNPFPREIVPGCSSFPDFAPNSTLSSMTTMQCTSCDPGWRAVEDMISYAQDQPINEVNHRTSIVMHVIITAISVGWTGITQSLLFDPRWMCLRQLDEVHFATKYGKVERLAVLMVTSQILRLNLRHATGREQFNFLHPFLRPRPSQLSIPHSVIADFYVWPGFRERLTFNRNEYRTKSFLQSIHSSFRFLWPFDFKDTYVHSRQTGLYQLSKAFLERSEDLRFWTMDSDFITAHPEFQGDVPVFNAQPMHISLKANHSGRQHLSLLYNQELEEETLSDEPSLIWRV